MDSFFLPERGKQEQVWKDGRRSSEPWLSPIVELFGKIAQLG